MKRITHLPIVLYLFGISNLFAQWTQLGNDIDGEAAVDESGYTVSLSTDGKRLAIGAYTNDGSFFQAGHVRVYNESGGVWTQLGNDIDGEAEWDLSGFSVSLSGDGKRLAIGAQGNDGYFSYSYLGHVRVYAENGGFWTQVGIDIDGEAFYDQSGWSVSLSSDGKRVAIGAPFNDGFQGAFYNAGHVRVYEESANTWTQVGSDINGEASLDESGRSVFLSANGTRLAIGAFGNDGNGNGSGHVRVYGESGGVWTQLGSDIDGEAAGDVSGFSVSLSADGKRLAIGGYGNSANGTLSGHVRVYAETGGVWTQLGSDIDGEAADDRCGFSVSLSADGKRLAIGAILNDGSGNNAGHVRVYSESGSIWTQIGNDIDGESANDHSGQAVSFSADGKRLAIGANENDGNGNLSGHVRVYDNSCPDADLDTYPDIACGGTDCDESNPDIHPGAPEVCNGLDDDCGGFVDEFFPNTDNDGMADCVDPDDDNDGCLDGNDDHPLVASSDTDGDNIVDDCDPDDDNDGCLDDEDTNPLTASADSDCDGVADDCDVCPGGDDSEDNNNDGIVDCSQLLAYGDYSSTWHCGSDKINVCHSFTNPGGFSTYPITLCVNVNALDIHYNHGDWVGPCASCTIPMMGPDESGTMNWSANAAIPEAFPNPASEEVKIKILRTFEAGSVKVYNLFGWLVLQRELEEGVFEYLMDIKHVQTGIYFIQVFADGESYVYKLTIQ
ncbi:MAG TPA: MopE-related protein [Saprospiraceae bacterium]|nr:MopE-related protein [Saprospiraceae bacterium]